MSDDRGSVELTILMPCLDEAETVATCVRTAALWLADHHVDGEVVVADNGSTDGSQRLAAAAGARVVSVADKGYGAALRGGISVARGTFVIMGDADESYDFSDLGGFVEQLRGGVDLVVGNRFAGGLQTGAMPWLHHYVGNPVLSFVGRLFFSSPVRDFHCGLRGFRRDSIMGLGLRTDGMEFASEMVVAATLAGLRITEVPTTLRPDGRTHRPHLRSFRDGWRHLRFLMIFSPRWLFVYPGLVMFVVGGYVTTRLVIGPIGRFDVGALLYSSAFTMIGFQGLLFGALMTAYGVSEGFLPEGRFGRLERQLTLERGLAVGVALIVGGIAVAVASFLRWQSVRFGVQDPAATVRWVTPAVLGLVLGFQTIFGSFSISVLAIKADRSAPETSEWTADSHLASSDP